MESLKEKLPMIIAVIIVIGLIVGVFYFSFIHEDIYYTQIDNAKCEQISSTDDMRYQYKLTAYNKNGKSKEVEFKTSRELRDDAYLELKMMSIRGVVNWKEVQENELPDKVQTEMGIK